MDIFKLMRNIERPKPKGNPPNKPPSQRMDLDEFVTGEEEPRFHAKKRRTPPVEHDLLDTEIGSDQVKVNPLKDLAVLDLVDLNNKPVNKQNVILKREYLLLYDKLKTLSEQLVSLTRESSEDSISLNETKKQNFQLKELVRLIGSSLPDGSELRSVLDNHSWQVEDIEITLLEKIKSTIDRAKNVDVIVDAHMKEATQEIKSLKRICLQHESQVSQFQTENTQLRDMITAQQQQFQTHYQQIQQHYEQQLANLSAAASPIPPTTSPAPASPAPAPPEEKAPTPPIPPTAAPAPAPPTPPTPASASPAPPTPPTPAPAFPAPPISPPPAPASPAPPAFDIPPPPTFDIPPVQSTPVSAPATEEPEDAAEEIDTHLLLDMGRHIDVMPEPRKYIIEVIGQTGISRNQELKEFLEQDEQGKVFFQKGSKFSYQDMSAATKGLKDSGYLLNERVNLGSKGGYNFQVFELSDTGKAIYQVLTRKRPAVPEKTAIVSQHKSLEHGYLIKDCASEFRDMGYTVYTERSDLRFDLPNGKRKDFDLIIEKDGEKCYIEVERGTHTDEDFFHAMDKIYQVMQQLQISPVPFHFISPNEQALFGKTKRQFFLWIKQRVGGIDDVKGKIVVHFTTFDKIKKRGKTIWEVIKP